MAPLTLLQVADLWIAAGGPRSRAVEWTAIELSEGGLSTDAVSPAGAIGPWQIMPFNAAPYGYTVADLYKPLVNARIAVAMSGHGTNCAAWDSCYRNILVSGRYRFLGWPETGSSVYDKLQWVAVALGHDKLGGQVPPEPATGFTGSAKVLAHLQYVLGRFMPRLNDAVIANRMAVGASFKEGWRP